MIASLILALHLLGIMAAPNAAYFLYIFGALLLIAELGIVSFGVLSINGLIALFAGYAIQTGDNLVLGVPLDWPFFFGIAFIEFIIIAIGVYVFLKLKNRKPTTGVESLIGEKAVVVEWNSQEGHVRIQGEIWAARSDKSMDLTEKEKVTITAIKDLTLLIDI